MNCKTTRIQLLADPQDAGDDAVRHMASCPECRELKTVLEALDASGRELRGADLSPDRIETTRREALQILAAGRRIPLVRWRPVTALAAAAVLLIAAVFGGYEIQGRRQAAEAERLAAAALDRRIERLQTQLAERLREFEYQYVKSQPPSRFEREREALGISMALSELEIVTGLFSMEKNNEKDEDPR